ncbi:hypothetical protein D3C84_341790 [compost metagenome]
MVMQGNLRRHAEDKPVGAFQDFVTDTRMGAHDGPLLFGEGAGLLEDVIGDPNLAHVMHGGRQLQQLRLLRTPARRAGQRASVGSHAPDMYPGVGVVVVTRLAQHHDGGTVAALELIETHQGEVVAHPGAHRARADRLVDVIHPARLEALTLAVCVVARRDKEHRDPGIRRIGLEPAAHLIAVHVGHAHVKQDQGWLVATHGGQPFLPPLGKEEVVLFLEDLPQQPKVTRLVVDDQHSRSIHGAGSSRSSR